MNIQILEAVSTMIEEQSGLLIMATSTFPVLQLHIYDAEFRMAKIRGEKVSLKSN